jgi:peptidyl-prolyl cis-trans isomerase C
MITKTLKDPLTLFILAGIVLYIGQAWWADIAGVEGKFEINVRTDDIARLQDQWAMQMRRPANDQELDGLLEQYVKEEIYYREAKRIGLERNDTIVRRRLVQKLTFLTEDVATQVAPTQAEIDVYFQENQTAYAIPERLTFIHRYFSQDRRPQAQQDAKTALSDAQITGDPFMLQREYAGRSQRELGDLFGREFAADLFELAPNENWQGPVKSAYGWHAVLITGKADSRIPAVEEILDRVVADAKQAERQKANELYFESLKAQYTINYPVAE